MSESKIWNARMVITPNLKKIMINKSKTRSFPGEKFALFEKDKKIDQKEQKRKLFNTSLYPKQIIYSQKVFSPKLKRYFF
jgi:hypothetical protein